MMPSKFLIANPDTGSFVLKKAIRAVTVDFDSTVASKYNSRIYYASETGDIVTCYILSTKTPSQLLEELNDED